MRGYFDSPAATAVALDGEGWLMTGDLGSMDEHGYCRVQGRLKDMIIRDGENIYPRESRKCCSPIRRWRTLRSACDPEWGEIVAAFVEAQPGTKPDGAELEALCRRHLASHEVPCLWRFVSHFPQTASGKLQKFVLGEQELQG
jgi:fatty-acyl-CoA synthase